MYRVRAAGILLLGAVWIAAVAAAEESPPAPPTQDPGIQAGASHPLLPGDMDGRPMPCGSDALVPAPVLGAENGAWAEDLKGTSKGGDAGPFFSQGTVQVPTSNLVALGIVVGLSFGGAAGLAASRLAGLRRRTAVHIAPAPPAPVAPVGPAAPGPATAPTPAPEQPKTHLERLVTSVKAHPGNGETHFDLALELIRRNEVDLGMRHLSTSFALYPQGVLRLLEDPTLVKIREHPQVVFALRTLHREQQRRFTGYV